MSIFLKIVLIFALGCSAGWFLELFYRSLISQKKLVNPGFLNGPYLPIYGFGMLIFYLLSELPLPLYYKIPVFGIAATLLELITGEFFWYFYHLRLWDYSQRAFNFKGLICPKFSLYWTAAATFFYLIIYPPLTQLVGLLQANRQYSFFLGIFYGVFFVDIWDTFSVARKIRKVIAEFNKEHLEKVLLDYRNLKNQRTALLTELKMKNSFVRYFRPITADFRAIDLNEYLTKNVEDFRQRVKAKEKKIEAKRKKKLSRKK